LGLIGVVFLLKKYFAFFLIILFFSSFSFAVLDKGEMQIYAVTTKGEGLVATLTLEIEPGSGKIWSAVTPLVGTSTQSAERTAVKVAEQFYPASNNYDYKFTISSIASVVEGPSAGAAMTLLTTSMLLDKPLSTEVSITGTINDDGSIGPVGGVFEKVKEASSTGVKLFMIPSGEAIQTVRVDKEVKSINLLEHGPSEWGVKVVEVETIEDAIKFAFTDLAEIDVNINSSNSIPEFVPEKIPLPAHLGSFKILTTNYIKETRQVTSEARMALASSLLEDSEVTSFLLEVLNDAEYTITRAELLNEQNYLYSAANFSFLARVNAIIVKEVSNNPSLLEADSTAFDVKLLELKQNLREFESDLNDEVPKEGIEWFASAQQRYTYAKNAVDSLVSGQTIVVDGTEDDKIMISLQKLQDYAFAVAWLDVSKDFYNLSQDSSGLVFHSNEFESLITPLIITVENKFAVVDENVTREDILRRIDSAKTEKEKNWFEASLFDIVSADSFLIAEIESSEKSPKELRELLVAKIASVEKKISDSNVVVGWAILYLDHAKYFLSSANYYDERELVLSSTSDLKSGIALVYLADKIFESSSSVIEFYSTQEVVSNVVPLIEKEKEEFIFGLTLEEVSLVSILLFLFCLMIILLLILFNIMRSKGNHFSILNQITHVKKEIKNIDMRLLRGKISENEYSSVKEKLLSKLSFLEAERREKASHIFAIDDYSSELKSYNSRIRGLRKHFKGKEISKDEFSSRLKDYLAHIEKSKSELEDEISNLAKQRHFLETIDLKSLGKKRMLPVLLGKEALTVKPNKKKMAVKRIVSARAVMPLGKPRKKPVKSKILSKTVKKPLKKKVSINKKTKKSL